jgi:hypothetical protein
MVRRTAQTAVWEQVGTTHKLVGQDTYYWGWGVHEKTTDKPGKPYAAEPTVKGGSGVWRYFATLESAKKFIERQVLRRWNITVKP